MSDSQRRSAPISRALDGCENARHTNGYASASRNHQNIKILAHLIHQNRSSWVGGIFHDGFEYGDTTEWDTVVP
jgi:hypothetical protein